MNMQHPLMESAVGRHWVDLSSSWIGTDSLLFQLGESNLLAMSGPRKLPTFWAAPWKSSPPPSSSINPKGPYRGLPLSAKDRMNLH